MVYDNIRICVSERGRYVPGHITVYVICPHNFSMEAYTWKAFLSTMMFGAPIADLRRALIKGSLGPVRLNCVILSIILVPFFGGKAENC
jgi:hypothetical protein